jgi:hypothetical protein
MGDLLAERNRYHAALFYILAHPEDAKETARRALAPPEEGDNGER